MQRLSFSWEKLVQLVLILVAMKEAQSEAAGVNGTIPALFAFGDSILDTGNNNNLDTLSKCNYPPYGRDFIGAQPTGRFCDGKVPTDLIAEALGIKEIVPAYLDPILRREDLSTGVCFASGGSGIDDLTSSTLRVLSLSTQLQNFQDYIGKLRGIIGEERTNSVISNSLYLISAANNDIAITYANTRRLEFDFPTYSNLLVDGASTFSKNLYGLGARRIWVLSTLPLGCLPGVRAAEGGLSGQCVDTVNEEAQLFNSQLSSELVSIKGSLVDYKLDFIDMYSPLLDLVQNPRNSGFENGVNGCCDTATSALCNPLNPFTCANPSKYVFWDSAHPTQAAYEHIVSNILQTHNLSTILAN